MIFNNACCISYLLLCNHMPTIISYFHWLCRWMGYFFCWSHLRSLLQLQSAGGISGGEGAEWAAIIFLSLSLKAGMVETAGPLFMWPFILGFFTKCQKLWKKMRLETARHLEDKAWKAWTIPDNLIKASYRLNPNSRDGEVFSPLDRRGWKGVLVTFDEPQLNQSDYPQVRGTAVMSMITREAGWHRKKNTELGGQTHGVKSQFSH